MMFRYFYCLLLALLGGGVLAQSKIQQLEVTRAKAEVISVLEGAGNIALLRIIEADTANVSFKIPDSELLCTFEFGVIARTINPPVPGIKSGDRISLELSGHRPHANMPYNYRAFRYWLIKETPSSPVDEQSQK